MSQAGRFTFLSLHGSDRLDQRTKLSERDIMEILDSGAYVDIGHEPGFDRRRLLFWSPPDQKPFVAIRDGAVGNVVTILPIEYNESRHRTVTQAEIEVARVKCIQRTTGPAKLELKVHFISPDGRQKTKSVWKATRSEEPEDAERLVAHAVVRREWVNAIAAAGIPSEQILSLSLGKGALKPRVDVPESIAQKLLKKSTPIENPQ